MENMFLKLCQRCLKKTGEVTFTNMEEDNILLCQKCARDFLSKKFTVKDILKKE